jgi:bacteriocin-like protein
MSNDIRELTIDELDAVSGGADPVFSKSTIVKTAKGFLEVGYDVYANGAVVINNTWTPTPK